MDDAPFYRRKDALACAALALLLRALVVAWAHERVPPSADGSFYHVVAGRIARGLGYTWLWPDGAVTYAAHYPIGYPALLGGAYAVFGSEPTVAMALNALLGAVGCWVVHALSFDVARAVGCPARASSAANAGALLVALSPTLLFYTPALMTEGAVGTCLALGAWSALRASRSVGARALVSWLVLSGVCVGAATLLRPQSIVMGAVFGGCAVLGKRWGQGGARAWLTSAFAAGLVGGVAVACCLPWTLRNCERMERCVFVSANGGWNLLIGTFPEGRGAFVGVEGERVPVECREVFQEAEKDVCFGRAGQRRIRGAPLAWLGLVPDKLRVTFDHTASAADHLSMAGAWGDFETRALRASELVVQRLSFLLVLLGVTRPEKGELRSGSLRWLLAGCALLFLGAGAYLAWAGLLAWALSSRRPQPFVVQVALGAVLLTFAVHAAFFGAGRYTIPLLVLLAPLSALGWAWLPRTFDRSRAVG